MADRSLSIPSRTGEESELSNSSLRSTLPLLPPISEARRGSHIRGRQYMWKHHEDNYRAFTKPSIIWQFGDEYRRIGSGQGTRYWRCGLCKTTILLTITDNSSTSLRC